ncbi:MAG: FecR domain-containing protein [Deltaproteobacteria bacterium]|nr:FecR domain-containing protein [Deltaproteobacteria bacterium]
MDNKKILIAAIVFACLMSLPIFAWAGPKQVGEVFFARGVVTAGPEGGEARFLGRGAPVFEGDVLATGERSFAVLHMSDGGKITLRPDTVFAIEGYSEVRKKENAIFRLFKGGIRAVSGFISKRNLRNGYRLKTPTAVLGIRGTEFDARLCKGDCAAEAKKIRRQTLKDNPSPVAGRVVRLRGILTARAQDGTERHLIKGGPVYRGDTLETGSGGMVVVVFRDNSRVTLLGESVFKVERYQFHKKKTDNAFFRLLKGGLRTFTGLMTRRDKKAFKLGTPTAIVGVRGTGFDVLLSEENRRAEAGKVAGRVVRLRGSLTVSTREGTERPLLKGSSVYEGDTLETGTKSMAILVFRDNSRVTLQAETSFKVERYQYHAKKKDNIFFRIFKGGLRVFTGMVVRRNARNFKIGTPTAVVGVRGTGFDLLYRGKPGTEEQALLPNRGLLRRMLDAFPRKALAATPKGIGTFAYNWKESKHPIEVIDKKGKTTVLSPGMAAFAPMKGNAFTLPSVPLPMLKNPNPKPDPKTIPADPQKMFGVKQGQYVSVWDGVIELELKSGAKLELSEGKTLFWPKGAVEPIELPVTPMFMHADPDWRPDPKTIPANTKDLFGAVDKTGSAPGLYVTVYDGHVTMENEGGAVELGKGEAGFSSEAAIKPIRLTIQPLFQVQDIIPFPKGFTEKDAQGILKLIVDELGEPGKKKEFECEIR